MIVTVVEVRAMVVGVADRRMGMLVGMPRSFGHMRVFVIMCLVSVLMPMDVRQRFMHVRMRVPFKAHQP